MRQNRPWPALADLGLYCSSTAPSTAPSLCWAYALATPVTFLTGDHVMQIGFGQISPSASSTRDLGTRLLDYRRNLSLSLRLVRDYGTVYTQIGVSSPKRAFKRKIHKLLPTVLEIEDYCVDAHSLILNFKKTQELN